MRAPLYARHQGRKTATSRIVAFMRADIFFRNAFWIETVLGSSAAPARLSEQLSSVFHLGLSALVNAKLHTRKLRVAAEEAIAGIRFRLRRRKLQHTQPVFLNTE
ncbi:MAG: hypothetical protein ACYDD1_12580 [Caulobacteraceae bacterium]